MWQKRQIETSPTKRGLPVDTGCIHKGRASIAEMTLRTEQDKEGFREDECSGVVRPSKING